MKLCIDLCHPAKSGAPPERHPVPASLAKAVRAASHPTNDLPARRPFPTRPSTFQPRPLLPPPNPAPSVRGCRSGRHLQKPPRKARPPAPGNPPAPSHPARRHSACATMSHLRPIGPPPTRPPNRPPKSRGGATPPTPHTGCTNGAYKTRAKVSLSIVSEPLAVYTFCIQNTGFSHANASQTVSKPCLHPLGAGHVSEQNGIRPGDPASLAGFVIVASWPFLNRSAPQAVLASATSDGQSRRRQEQVYGWRNGKSASGSLSHFHVDAGN
jgi:hypothetical protein